MWDSDARINCYVQKYSKNIENLRTRIILKNQTSSSSSNIYIMLGESNGVHCTKLTSLSLNLDVRVKVDSVASSSHFEIMTCVSETLLGTSTIAKWITSIVIVLILYIIH